jgi:hypothetical protein
MPYMKMQLLGISILLVVGFPFRAAAVDANASDLAQANKFLVDIPPACSKSYKIVGDNGAVNIHILCEGNGKKMDGLVVIKDGVVTKIR